MSEFGTRKLLARVLVVVLLAVVPALGALVYAGMEHHRSTSEAVRSETSRLARLIAQEESRLIEHARQLMSALGRIPEVRDRVRQECDVLLQEVARGQGFAHLAVVDGQGAVVCNASPDLLAYDLAEHPEIEAVLRGHGFVRGGYGVDPATGASVFRLASPLEGLDGPLVLYAGLDLRWLASLVHQAQFPTGSTVTVFDENGHVLFRRPDPTPWVGREFSDTSLIATVRERRAGTQELEGLDGVDRLYAFTTLSQVRGEGAYLTVGIPSGVAFADARRARTVSLTGFGVGVFLALLGAFFFGRTVLVRPVQRSTETLREAHTALQESEQRYADAYRAEQRTTERLRELDAVKNEFMAMVVHDLRSPLAVIGGYAQTLTRRWDALEAHQRTQCLDAISRTTDRLNAMVEQVIQIARIESGEFSYEQAPFDLAEVISGTVGDFEELQTGHRLRTQIPDDLPKAFGDRERNWQVLSNLLSNAVKFSPTGETIEVVVYPVAGRLAVAVRDRGPGIPRGELPKLFRRFSRLKQDGEIVQGTGLGLYICKKMVEAQGGTIDVETEVGVGTTFTYTIPVAQEGSS